ncbi:MAG: LytR C-terminal domain-containing protein [Candidatus Daviesbacteria bacterium]
MDKNSIKGKNEEDIAKDTENSEDEADSKINKLEEIEEKEKKEEKEKPGDVLDKEDREPASAKATVGKDDDLDDDNEDEDEEDKSTDYSLQSAAKSDESEVGSRKTEDSLNEEYFLEVAKDDEKPKWPRPEEELKIGSQHLSGDYTQYWAYLKTSNKDPHDLPEAEKVASENYTAGPVLIISRGQKEAEDSEYYLEIIIAKNGHAWGKTESSLDNLEDNITSSLDFAKEKFDMNISQFMTTASVPAEVERKLDEFESGGKGEEEEQEEKEVPTEPETAVEEAEDKPPVSSPIRPVGSGASKPLTSIGVGLAATPKQPVSKILVILPIVILCFLVGTILFKDQVFGSLGKVKDKVSSIVAPAPSPTPTPEASPTPSPTPTPSFERSDYKVRVLNGTGETGAAVALLDSLVEKGWGKGSAGNATASAVVQTYIRAKKDLDEVVKGMISDLAPNLEATVSSVLKDSEKIDLEVVIGKK